MKNHAFLQQRLRIMTIIQIKIHINYHMVGSHKRTGFEYYRKSPIFTSHFDLN